MVQVVEVQFHPWDQSYYFDPEGNPYSVGERVLVRTEIGTDLGVVICAGEVKEEDLTSSLKPILRKANSEDLERMKEQQDSKEDAMQRCREQVKKSNLDMRLVDCAFSFDGGRVTFAFTAPSRVDFRTLLKGLNHIFQKSIRLQQIGVRDAAKYVGGLGVCGRRLCCSTFLTTLGSVSTDLARLQDIDHRGTDRLLGSCGRLRCCLRFEADMYPGYQESMASQAEENKKQKQPPKSQTKE